MGVDIFAVCKGFGGLVSGDKIRPETSSLDLRSASPRSGAVPESDSVEFVFPEGQAAAVNRRDLG
jgi:hypothetical protein